MEELERTRKQIELDIKREAKKKVMIGAQHCSAAD